MDNYVYIVSCLPVLTPDATPDAGQVIAGIREQLSERDNATVSFLLDGFDGEKLDADFYRKAFSSGSAFLRAFFGYDLDLRNAKARYLNRAFGRPEEMDTVLTAEDEEREFEDARSLDEILAGDDILGREKALDRLLWRKIDALTTFDYFDLDAILGFIAKLKITDRWLKLDEQTGRALFRRISDDVRATFQGVSFEG